MRVTIINCFDVYDRRVELLQASLRAEGHQVSVLIPNFRHTQKCMRAHCLEGFEMLPVLPYYSRFSPARVRSHMRFSRDALLRARSLRPDLLWVLVPPNSLVRDAALYKEERSDMKLVLDFMDLWPESMPVPGFCGTLFGRLWRGLRDRYVDAADAIVTESGKNWPALQGRCDRKKLCTLFVPRSFELRYLEGQPPRDRIALCFLGQVNRDVDFQAIGSLIQSLERPVELHVIGDGDQIPLLRQTAENAGAIVTFHGGIYVLSKKREIFDRCHVGLNLLKNGTRSGLTMKCVDYLESSLPIINNVQGDTWDFIARYPVGLNYDESIEITASKMLALQCRREQIRAFYQTYFAERLFSMNLRNIIRS
ncbi:glycosyltransferase [Oscillospiraceae bacterium 50-60]